MRVRADQLEGQLARGLAPVYVVSGAEPLQLEEALDRLRAAAREQGFTDRVVLHAGAGFDWTELAGVSDSLSLFATRRVIDLRVPGGRPGDAGARALRAYAERPGPDDLLVVALGDVDAAVTRAKWYQALEKAGVAVQVWPVAPDRLPAWAERRARGAGLRLSPDAAELLAERAEGNLLALAQEIDKLALLAPGESVDAERLADVVADSARFDTFDLVDAMLAGAPGRVVRVTRALRDEGAELPAVLGALAWAMRGMAEIGAATEAGEALDRVLSRGANRTWSRRAGMVGGALARRPSTGWMDLLARAARVDRIAKGLGESSTGPVARGAYVAWDELERLALAGCGRPPRPRTYN